MASRLFKSLIQSLHQSSLLWLVYDFLGRILLAFPYKGPTCVLLFMSARRDCVITMFHRKICYKKSIAFECSFPPPPTTSLNHIPTVSRTPITYYLSTMTAMVATIPKPKELEDPHRLLPVDLDPSLYHPSPQILEFLHQTITTDNEDLKRIVLDVQEQYVQQNE